MSLATNTLKADWSDLEEYAALMKVHVFYYFKNFLNGLLGKEGWLLLFWSTLNLNIWSLGFSFYIMYINKHRIWSYKNFLML